MAAVTAVGMWVGSRWVQEKFTCPAYNTSRGYVDRVNTSNTNVSNTTITNVYNNQVTNNKHNNVTYVNRTVHGAVTAVPQNAFRSSTPVARAAVPVNEQQIAAAPVVSERRWLRAETVSWESPPLLPIVWRGRQQPLLIARWWQKQHHLRLPCHLPSNSKSWQSTRASHSLRTKCKFCVQQMSRWRNPKSSRLLRVNPLR